MRLVLFSSWCSSCSVYLLTGSLPSCQWSLEFFWTLSNLNCNSILFLLSTTALSAFWVTRFHCSTGLNYANIRWNNLLILQSQLQNDCVFFERENKVGTSSHWTINSLLTPHHLRPRFIPVVSLEKESNTIIILNGLKYPATNRWRLPNCQCTMMLVGSMVYHNA